MKKYFLESIDLLLVGADYVDVDITDYNLRRLKKLKHLSPLRWITAHNSNIYPGHGEGQLVIGGETFEITYAWGGRNAPNNYKKRTSFTVRLKGKNLKERLDIIRQQIILTERGSLSYTMPFREVWNRIEKGNPMTAKFHRKTMMTLNEWLKEKGKKLIDIEKSVRQFKEDVKKNPPVTFYYHMERIEPDMLGKPLNK